ncbi:hypothetical protein EZV62_020478 [Acer yangbiense]|uniref:Uncharacterized protein n=1 Tax=Acer yangbiense TaxID=1000413 RepID=A0A5C7HFP4_9ROSI|nr:hypothetical protein EZV62_020478 [Acer yangbiense]
MQSRLTITLAHTLRRSTRAFSSSAETSTQPFQFPQTLAGLYTRLATESSSLTDFVDLQSNDSYSVEVGTKKRPLPKLKWMRESIPRGDKFCNVKTSRTPPLPDPNEPTNVAEAIASWGLDYVVITSVDRDDLPDQGSGHFAETVQKLKALKPNMLLKKLSNLNLLMN